MMASTFINAEQLNYDDFTRQTREMLQHVREHAQQPQGKADGGAAAHA
jgi:hypothetical protein